MVGEQELPKLEGGKQIVISVNGVVSLESVWLNGRNIVIMNGKGSGKKQLAFAGRYWGKPQEVLASCDENWAAPRYV